MEKEKEAKDQIIDAECVVLEIGPVDPEAEERRLKHSSPSGGTKQGTVRVTVPKGELSPRYARVIENMMGGMNGTDAYMKEYPNASRATAGTEASRVIKTAREVLLEEFEEQGLTAKVYVKKLFELMEAKNKIRTKDGTEEVPDNPSRVETMKLIAKLKDYEPIKKTISVGVTYDQIAAHHDSVFGVQEATSDDE